MAKVKPIVKFKTYKQSARVGGKIYGVANLADPVVPEVTMQECIDYAKLHNFSAAQLEALISQVLQAAADLVARDGRPRNLSELLKFEPVIKGTFSNLEAGVTNQKIVIRPRLLKEIRVNLPSDAFSWQNVNDTTAPRVISWAIDTTEAAVFTELAWQEAIAASITQNPYGVTVAGERLAPLGWQQGYAIRMYLQRGDVKERIDYAELTNGGYAGLFDAPLASDPMAATENTLLLKGHAHSSESPYSLTWVFDGDNLMPGTFNDVRRGDKVVFEFDRPLFSDGTVVTAVKAYDIEG